MNNISEKISKQIKDQAIKPKSKKYFVIFRVLLWGIIAATLIILSLAMSLNWEILSQHDVPLMMRGTKKILPLVKVIPYFWVVISTLLAITVYFELQRTKKAYKLRLIYIILIILSSTLFLSTIFYLVDISEKIEEKLEKQKPYHNMIPVAHEVWLNPQDGMLWGNIQQVQMKEIKLEDINNQQWLVILQDDTLVHDKVILEPGELIRIIGQQENNAYIFNAQMINPWKKGVGKNKSKPCFECMK